MKMNVSDWMLLKAYLLSPKALRRFLRKRILPKTLCTAITNRLRILLKNLGPTEKLVGKLWCGFSGRALPELTDLQANPQTPANDARRAAWELARFHFASMAFDQAYQMAVAHRAIYPAATQQRAHVLLESDCLVQLGKPAQARKVLQGFTGNSANWPDGWLAMANTYCSPHGQATDPAVDRQRLALINQCYLAAGLAPIVLKDSTAALTLRNLGTDPVPDWVAKDMPLVSVVLPIYNAERTLAVAMDSLLAQTWQNLEILIVDDCSTDGSFAFAHTLAARDSRVRVLQSDRNQGAYLARNLALRHARGDLVTVHDADDWSHPQKIEVQAKHLTENPDQPATISNWVRAQNNLMFRGHVIAADKIIQRNHSSLMLRRDLLSRLGGWDRVRISADSEFIRRLEHLFGHEAIYTVYPFVPLSFALDAAGTLTQRSATHVRTLQFGVRRCYQDSATYWRKTLPLGQLPALPATGRAFPAPPMILPDRQETVILDRLIIADFNNLQFSFRYWRKLVSGKGSVGLFQWPEYDSDVTLPIRAQVMNLAQNRLVQIISPGQGVAADLLLADPLVLASQIDIMPRIAAKQARLIHAPRNMTPDAWKAISQTVFDLCGARPAKGIGGK